MRHERILVIEEDETSAEAKGHALRTAGYRVYVARGTAAALRSLRDVQPDLVVFAKGSFAGSEDDLLSLRQATWAPLVLVGPREDAAEMLDSGADSYRHVPVSLVELVATAHALLRRRLNEFDSPRGHLGVGIGDHR